MFISTIMVSYCLIFLNCYIFFPIIILEYFAFKFILKNHLKSHPIALSILIFINQGLLLCAGVSLHNLLFNKSGQTSSLTYLGTFLSLIFLVCIFIFAYINIFSKLDKLTSKLSKKVYLCIFSIYFINIVFLTLLASEFLFDYMLFFSNL